MAELLIKIKNGAGYSDGDIIASFNSRAIKQRHIEHICFERNVNTRKYDRLNSSTGLLNPGDVAQDCCERLYEFRFERLSSKEGRVVRLSDGDTINFRSNETFIDHRGKAVQMDIDKHISSAVTTLNKNDASGKPIFGVQTGQEIWYGGRIDLSNTKLELVWDDIEAKTSHLRTESKFQLWPAGYHDIRSHLLVRTADFTDEEANNLVLPQYQVDGNGDKIVDSDGGYVVLAKRNYNTDWRNILSDLGVTESQVQDPTFPIGVTAQLLPNILTYNSKNQPEQANRGLLLNKTLQGPPP